VPRLLERVTAAQVDAVLISHGHPDHCADPNPLLRARVLRDDPPPPLPVYALPGALDAVLRRSSASPGSGPSWWFIPHLGQGAHGSPTR
jgi:ribonuclease BN (tRNA processing enzyme)